MAALAMMPVNAAANARRRARKELLDELRKAPTKQDALDRCAGLLLSADPALDGVTVFDLIRNCYCVSRSGPYSAGALLRSADVDPGVLVGDILVRDALRLAAVLRAGHR